MEKFFNNLENIQIDQFMNETRVPDYVTRSYRKVYAYFQQMISINNGKNYITLKTIGLMKN